MKTLFTFLFLAVATACVAQKKQNVYFLKDDGRYVDVKDSADFIRIVSEPDSGTQLYNITEFYKSGTRKLAAKSSTIAPPKLEDMSVSNYETGARKSVNNYKNNILTGNQYEFFPNGKPYIVKRYPEKAEPIKWDQPAKPTISTNAYSIVANYDSLGTQLVNEGNGHYKGYDPAFKYVFEEGDIKDGKREGEWTGKKDSVRFVETYKDGVLMQGVATWPTGITTTYNNERFTLPGFPGGPNKFNGFLAKNLRYPPRERESNIQGKVVVCFDVDTNGKLNNFKIISAPATAMADEVIRVMRLNPNWLPAKNFGRNVTANFTQSIGFNLGEDVYR